MAETGAGPVRPVTAAEIDAFWDDGVVCLRGVLDPARARAAMASPVEVALAWRRRARTSREMGRALAAAGETAPDRR